MVPVGILLAVGVGMTIQGATAGAVLLVAALSLATQKVFAVARYLFANGAPNTGGFAASDLEEPFRRR